MQRLQAGATVALTLDNTPAPEQNRGVNNCCRNKQVGRDAHLVTYALAIVLAPVRSCTTLLCGPANQFKEKPPRAARSQVHAAIHLLVHSCCPALRSHSGIVCAMSTVPPAARRASRRFVAPSLNCQSQIWKIVAVTAAAELDLVVGNMPRRRLAQDDPAADAHPSRRLARTSFVVGAAGRRDQR